MKNLKHIFIICFFASFALGSCSKMAPLQKATVADSTQESVMTKAASNDNVDVDGEGITDPDHDEDHDKDNVSSIK